MPKGDCSTSETIANLLLIGCLVLLVLAVGVVLDVAVSLHHRLLELTDALLNSPDVGEREMADMLDDAQLALDKWNGFWME